VTADAPSIHVRNFRSIAELHLVPVPNLVVLIGRNNAGKSNVVDVFRFLSEGSSDLSGALARRGGSFQEITRNKVTSPALEIVVDLRLADESRRLFLHDLYEGTALHEEMAMQGRMCSSIRYSLTAEGERVTERYFIQNMDQSEADTLAWERVVTGQSFRFRTSHPAAAARRDPPGMPVQVSLQDSSSGGSGLISNLEGSLENFTYAPNHTLEDNLRREYAQWLSTVHWLNPARVSNPRMQIAGTPGLLSDASNLVDVLHGLANNRRVLFEKIQQIATEIVPEIGNFLTRTFGVVTTLAIGDPHSAAELQYTFDQLSWGTREVLAIVTFLITSQEGSLLIIEEPEAHLHPAAQARLFTFLEAQTRTKQVLLVSHSVVFASLAPLESVFHVRREDGGRTVLVPVTESNVGVLMEDLGIRPSFNFSSDSVVFVEGQNDIPVLEVWGGRFWRSRRVQFIDTEGWTNMEYFANARVLSERENRVKVYVVFDGDTEANARRKKLKERIVRELNVPTDRILTLPSAELEGLLLDSGAILAAFPEIQSPAASLDARVLAARGHRDQKGRLAQLLQSEGVIGDTPRLYAMIASKVNPAPPPIAEFFARVSAELPD
jgi:predicted ATPase